MGARYIAWALVAATAMTMGPGAQTTPRPQTTPPPQTTPRPQSTPPAQALRVAAAPVRAFVRDFNPFDPALATNRDGVTQFIYEPLVEYDGAQDNQYYPWLASSWTFSSSGQNVTFDLRNGVHWQDGSLLSAADVAYTFDLVKQEPSLAGDLPVVSAVASGPLTFTLTLSRPAYAYLYRIAEVPIVKAGYAKGSRDVSDYVDASPDGTGPYASRPGGFSPGQVVLSGRSRYWQGAPPIQQLDFPALPTPGDISRALLAGDLDWAQAFMPDVGTYVARDPAHDHFWFAPDSCTTLELNFSVGPFSQLAVRRAISNALDRSALSRVATGGYDPPATDASGLVLPRDAQFLPAGKAGALSAHSRPQATALIMKSAGYRLSGSGTWTDRNGRPVVLDIAAPAGTALATMAGVAAAQLRRAGFQASSSDLPPAKFASALATGAFQAAIVAGNKEPSPFYEYDSWLDATQVSGGHAIGGDFERLTTASAPTLVRAAAGYLAGYESSAPGSPASGVALEHLAALTARELPVIPLVYDVAWGEYSTRLAQGWPAGADPYEPATPSAPYAEYTVLQLNAGL